jgi:hypothetical protein
MRQTFKHTGANVPPLQLNPALRAKLGPEMKMDTHWVDVKLQDGRKFMNLVVRGGAFLSGFAEDPNGEGTLPFTANDIVAIRRRSLFGALSPFWGRKEF